MITDRFSFHVLCVVGAVFLGVVIANVAAILING